MFFLSVILFTTHYLPISTKTDCIHNYCFFYHIFLWKLLKIPQYCNPYPLTLGPILAEWCHIFKFCEECLKADEIYYTLRHKEIFWKFWSYRLNKKTRINSDKRWKLVNNPCICTDCLGISYPRIFVEVLDWKSVHLFWINGGNW